MKKRTIYFNDARHYYLFVFEPPMDLQDAWVPIDECAGTSVNTFVYGVSRADGLFYPSNLVGGNQFLTLDMTIEDQVAKYKQFEESLKVEKIAETPEPDTIKPTEIICNVDSSYDKLSNSLGEFPDQLYLSNQTSPSTLDDLIKKQLALGIIDVNIHNQPQASESVDTNSNPEAVNELDIL